MAQNPDYSGQSSPNQRPGSGRRWQGPPPKRDQRPRPVVPPASSPSPQSVSSPKSSKVETSPSQFPPKNQFWQAVLKKWPIWSLGSLAVVGGVGIVSAISLFRIPNLPNCRAIFWPTASATTRIQCAEAFAEQNTVNGYLDAIELVDRLPRDHPLRANINQRIEDWAEQVLELAEFTFQEGDLAEAVTVARRIPEQTTAADLVNQRVQRWNRIWEEAEAIYASAEQEFQNRNFKEAFAKATQLLEVNNRYWATTKYDQLTTLISDGRRDLNRLAQARRLAGRNTVNGIGEAIDIAKSIAPESPLYDEAQGLVKEWGRALLPLVDQALAQEEAFTAAEILNKVPAEAGLANEVADYRTIIQAEELSWQGTVRGLEGGIVRLQSISRNRPLYGRAQQLISEWRQEIEGLSYLEWARQVANPGTIGDLQAAIAEARQVPPGNPVWDQAQTQIKQWQREIETTQDQPFLDQAQRLAEQGNLRGAIASAEMIEPGRALYDQAQERMERWQTQIQRSEDQPILSQAQQLAAAGDLQQAITVASQIRSGRVLYADAQQDISQWRSRLEGQRQLQRANQIAQLGTANALIEAIQVAQQVPSSSPQKSAADEAISRWSWDVLSVAEQEAPFNPERAIELAAQIPEGTAAYAPAQLQIQEWQAQSAPMEDAF